MLKALGFGNTQVWMLIVVEAAVLTFVAAAIGLAVAAAVFPAVFKSIAGGPGALPVRVIPVGLAIALLLAALSATIPAMRARRLTIVQALSGR